MLVKIVTFFLIFMAVLALFGRLRLPWPGRKPDLPPRPRKCPDCGAYILGNGRCRCKGG